MFQTYLVILVFAFAIPQAIMAEGQTEGILLYSNHQTNISNSRTTRPALDDRLFCPAGAMGPVCSSDCKTLLTCVSGNLISFTQCADLSIDYPYCVPNTLGCTGEPDLSYDTCVSRTEPPVEFTCTSPGYFPSPHNCADYFFCGANIVYKYTCPPNYVYDSLANICQPEYSPEGLCHTIDCTLTPNRYAVFPGNHVFYAFCSSVDGITETIMFRCENAGTHVFNPYKTICEFKCRSAGKFQHESDYKYFYECYYANGVLVSRIQSCPDGYFFYPPANGCA